MDQSHPKHQHEHNCALKSMKTVTIGILKTMFTMSGLWGSGAESLGPIDESGRPRADKKRTISLAKHRQALASLLFALWVLPDSWGKMLYDICRMSRETGIASTVQISVPRNFLNALRPKSRFFDSSQFFLES
jgi:hypothetical protein